MQFAKSAVSPIVYKDQEFWVSIIAVNISQVIGNMIFVLQQVSFLDYFVNERYSIALPVRAFLALRNEVYYEKWDKHGQFLLLCKIPGNTESFLKEETLDVFTHNKALQVTENPIGLRGKIKKG